MRFPTRKISDGLRDSLMDAGIITNNKQPEHFDLPIQETPIQELLAKMFDLHGDFHIGCSAARRPPSFGFHTGYGDTQIWYNRILKFGEPWPFFSKRNSKGSHIRDLEALAKAYNQKENYLERLSLTWRKDMHPTIFLEFNNNLLTKSDLRYALEDYCVFEKLSNPIYNCAKNTKLEEIAKSCKKTTFVQPKDLSKMGYSVADIAFGFFQTTYNACGKSSTCLVKNIEESREMITKTFSAYKPAPKNYNHDLSSLFPAMGL